MPIRCSAVSVGALLALLSAPAPAFAANYQPSRPPALCSGPTFADQIGTERRDWLQADRRPERLWGLAGDDVLTGSEARATCLFGGGDGDRLTLEAGGGAAFGETGSDALTGGVLDDVLRGGAGEDALTGGPGADTIDGGKGRDAISAGEGDDSVDAVDGLAELVDCGPGQDRVAADRADALIGCEDPALAGPSAQRSPGSGASAAATDIVRMRFTAPEAAGAGAYRILMTSGCMAGAEVARVGARVRAGRRIRIGMRPPPEAGWCAGSHRAVVVLARECPKRRRCTAPPPLEPIARLDFRVPG